MNSDEVSNMTIINTTWVKKAGGGTCNVPSTDEAHEVKKQLCDLYARLTALEEAKDAAPCAEDKVPKPPSRCEGCAEYPCSDYDGGYKILHFSRERPGCYRQCARRECFRCHLR